MWDTTPNLKAMFWVLWGGARTQIDPERTEMIDGQPHLPAALVQLSPLVYSVWWLHSDLACDWKMVTETPEKGHWKRIDVADTANKSPWDRRSEECPDKEKSENLAREATQQPRRLFDDSESEHAQGLHSNVGSEALSQHRDSHSIATLQTEAPLTLTGVFSGVEEGQTTGILIQVGEGGSKTEALLAKKVRRQVAFASEIQVYAYDAHSVTDKAEIQGAALQLQPLVRTEASKRKRAVRTESVAKAQRQAMIQPTKGAAAFTPEPATHTSALAASASAEQGFQKPSAGIGNPDSMGKIVGEITHQPGNMTGKSEEAGPKVKKKRKNKKDVLRKGKKSDKRRKDRANEPKL